MAIFAGIYIEDSNDYPELMKNNSYEKTRLSNENFASACLERFAIELGDCDYQTRHNSFLNYLNEETHYRLEQCGWRWNGHQRRFEGLSQEKYLQIRNNVIHRFALRAIDLFSGIEKNLKASLAE